MPLRGFIISSRGDFKSELAIEVWISLYTCDEAIKQSILQYIKKLKNPLLKCFC